MSVSVIVRDGVTYFWPTLNSSNHRPRTVTTSCPAVITQPFLWSLALLDGCRDGGSLLERSEVVGGQAADAREHGHGVGTMLRRPAGGLRLLPAEQHRRRHRFVSAFGRDDEVGPRLHVVADRERLGNDGG